MVARDYVARTLNLALNTTLTKRDVQIANAMESIGLAMPIERYNSFNSTVRQIPYTVVRGMSNPLHNTVNQTSPGVWQPGPAVPPDFANGYASAYVFLLCLCFSLSYFEGDLLDLKPASDWR